MSAHILPNLVSMHFVWISKERQDNSQNTAVKDLSEFSSWNSRSLKDIVSVSTRVYLNKILERILKHFMVYLFSEDLQMNQRQCQLVYRMSSDYLNWTITDVVTPAANILLLNIRNKLSVNCYHTMVSLSKNDEYLKRWAIYTAITKDKFEGRKRTYLSVNYNEYFDRGFPKQVITFSIISQVKQHESWNK